MEKRKAVLLDSGVLAAVTHPRGFPDIGEWLQDLLHADTVVLVPEIADYELRRELLRAGKQKSIIRLNSLKTNLGFLPIDTSAMLLAAEFWAEARKRGIRPPAIKPWMRRDPCCAGRNGDEANGIGHCDSNDQHRAPLTLL